MIRVLHLLGELRPSGMEKMLAVAAPFWRDRGVACTVASTGLQPGPFRDTLERAGYPILHVPFDRRRPLAHLAAVRRLFRDQAWDAVHLHTEQAMTYYALLAAAARIPNRILTKHGLYPYSGPLRLVRAFQRRLIRLTGGRFVAISPSVRDAERRLYGNPCLWIRNWIDTAAFTPADEATRRQRRIEFGLPADRPLLLTAGNCSPVKNHGLLLDALADLKREHVPFFYAHLGLEGDAGERDRCRELGLEAECRFVGASDQVSRYMQAADLFVHPSLREGFGNAVLEALSCGLRAVLTRVPGLADFEADFDSLLYAEPTRASLAARLRTALTDDARDRAARAARHHAVAVSLFGPEAGVAAYAALYAGRGGRSAQA